MVYLRLLSFFTPRGNPIFIVDQYSEHHNVSYVSQSTNNIPRNHIFTTKIRTNLWVLSIGRKETKNYNKSWNTYQVNISLEYEIGFTPLQNEYTKKSIFFKKTCPSSTKKYTFKKKETHLLLLLQSHQHQITLVISSKSSFGINGMIQHFQVMRRW